MAILRALLRTGITGGLNILLIWASFATGLRSQEVPWHSPTGADIAAVGDKLFLVNGSSKVFVQDKSGDARATILVTDERFKSLQHVTSSGSTVFISDPEAGAVFQVDSNGSVEKMLIGDGLIRPGSIAVTSKMAVVDGKSTISKQLWFSKEAGNCIYDVDLLSPGRFPREHCDFVKPSALAMSGPNLVVADSGPGTLDVLSQSGRRGYGNEVRLLSTISAVDFLSKLSAITKLVPVRGVLYALSGTSLYAVVASDSQALPLFLNNTLITGASSFTVDDDSVYVVQKGQVKKLPRPVPVTMDLEIYKNSSAVSTAMYRYLYEAGVLPTTAVKVPYSYTLPDGTSGKCSSVFCIARVRRLLLSGWITEFGELACKLNPHLCTKGKWRTLYPGDQVIIPLIPEESYLGFILRDLDGKSTVGAVIKDQLSRSGERSDKWSDLITNDALRRMNPSLGDQDILSSKIHAKAVLLPAVLFRYYFAVPRSQLNDPRSRFWREVKRVNLERRVMSVHSLETSTHSESEDLSNSTPVETFEIQQRSVNSAMSHDPDSSFDRGKDNPVLVLLYEDHPDCSHPVFFDKTRTNAFKLEPQCPVKKDDWKTSPVESLPSDDHGTCVASIAGPRSLPYDSKPFWSSITLQEVPKRPSDLNGAVKNTALTPGTAVVNISQADYGDTAADSWASAFDSLEGKQLLFVVAAGNDSSPVNKAKAYPALLARARNNVLSVAALNASGQDFWKESEKLGSNHGPEIELLAPGQAVPCAAHISGDEAFYTLANGTSMATALVSKVASRLMQMNLSPSQVKGRLLATADRFKSPNGSVYGGKLNVDKALQDPGLPVVEQEDEHGHAGSVPIEILQDSPLRLYLAGTDPEGGEDIPLIHVKRIEKIANERDASPLYRVVYRTRIVDPQTGLRINNWHWIVVEDVHLQGCLKYRDKKTGTPFVIAFESCSFGAANPAAGFKNYIGPFVNNDIDRR